MSVQTQSSETSQNSQEQQQIQIQYPTCSKDKYGPNLCGDRYATYPLPKFSFDNFQDAYCKANAIATFLRQVADDIDGIGEVLTTSKPSTTPCDGFFVVDLTGNKIALMLNGTQLSALADAVGDPTLEKVHVNSDGLKKVADAVEKYAKDNYDHIYELVQKLSKFLMDLILMAKPVNKDAPKPVCDWLNRHPDILKVIGNNFGTYCAPYVLKPPTIHIEQQSQSQGQTQG